MRRSFGCGSGGMGGGSGGAGSGMLRTVHRAIRTGGISDGGATHDPFTHATNTTSTVRTTTCKNKSNSNNTTIAFPSSTRNNSNSNCSASISAAATSTPTWFPTGPSSPPYSACDDSEWEQIDGGDCHENGYQQHACFDELVFGSVPSRDEVQHAVSALQQVLDASSLERIDFDSGKKGGSSIHMLDSDWIEPSVHLANSKMVRPYGAERVYDAFHMLDTDPSVQRMVLSLSSDRVIWNALLNNEAVREFRESLNQGSADTDSSSVSSSDNPSDSVSSVLSWISNKIKARVADLVNKIMKLVNEVFQPPEGKTAGVTVDPLEEKLRGCFLLSVIVLLIVLVNRAS